LSKLRFGQNEKSTIQMDSASIRVGDEGFQIPITRRAVDKSTPSLCSGGTFSV